MIDYLTLMLANLTAGLVVMAWFLLRGINAEDRKSWAPAFGVVGLIATVTGFAMTIMWPLPGKVAVFNIPYGEMTVLFGVPYLGAAWALAKGWRLGPLTIVGALGGAWAILVGQQFIALELSNEPLLAGVGFIATGAGGILVAVAVCLKRVLPVRIVVAAVLLAAAVIWGMTTCNAYRDHLDRFSKDYREAKAATPVPKAAQSPTPPPPADAPADSAPSVQPVR